MGTLCAIHVRLTDPAKANAFRAEYPTAFTETGSEYYAVEHAPRKPPEADYASLSARLDTDVLYLSFQSVVDAFEYHRWRSGQRLRTLVYGCWGPQERTWERVEGKAEAWESAAIFDPRHLTTALRHVTEAEAAELGRIWAEMEIVPGRIEPYLDARETARKVAEFYHLPGWS